MKIKTVIHWVIWELRDYKTEKTGGRMIWGLRESWTRNLGDCKMGDWYVKGMTKFGTDRKVECQS